MAPMLDSELVQRSENRIQDHQREGRDGRYGTVISTSVQETTLSDSRGRLLRMEESSGRQNSVFDQYERRFSIRLRWFMGRLERSGKRWMGPHLHDHYGRAEWVRAGDPYPDAGHPTRRASRCLVVRENWKGDFGPLPGRPDEGVADQFSCK